MKQKAILLLVALSLLLPTPLLAARPKVYLPAIDSDPPPFIPLRYGEYEHSDELTWIAFEMKERDQYNAQDSIRNIEYSIVSAHDPYCPKISASYEKTYIRVVEGKYGFQVSSNTKALTCVIISDSATHCKIEQLSQIPNASKDCGDGEATVPLVKEAVPE